LRRTVPALRRVGLHHRRGTAGGRWSERADRLDSSRPELVTPLNSSPPAGSFVDGSYANSHGSRRYKLFVPSRQVGKPLPLLVMLHGCLQDPDDFALGTRMNTIAEEQRIFVLYPEQSEAANQTRCWNWFSAANQ